GGARRCRWAEARARAQTTDLIRPKSPPSAWPGLMSASRRWGRMATSKGRLPEPAGPELTRRPPTRSSRRLARLTRQDRTLRDGRYLLTYEPGEGADVRSNTRSPNVTVGSSG